MGAFRKSEMNVLWGKYGLNPLLMVQKGALEDDAKAIILLEGAGELLKILLNLQQQSAKSKKKISLELKRRKEGNR